MRSLGETVRLDARTKLLNPKWYEGMLSSGYEGVREIQKRLTNTMGWSATSGMVDNWVYDEVGAGRAGRGRVLGGRGRVLGGAGWQGRGAGGLQSVTFVVSMVWLCLPTCPPLLAVLVSFCRHQGSSPARALPAPPTLLCRPTPPSLRTPRWLSA